MYLPLLYFLSLRCSHAIDAQVPCGHAEGGGEPCGARVCLQEMMAHNEEEHNGAMEEGRLLAKVKGDGSKSVRQKMFSLFPDNG